MSRDKETQDVRVKQDPAQVAREMARHAGEAFGHLLAAERAIKDGLTKMTDEDLAELDPCSEVGIVVDQVVLALRRAVLPVAAAAGALATAVQAPEGPR